jgi:hypothetical protein
MLVDPDARDIVDEIDSPTAKKTYPIFGLGIGFRF